MKKNSLHIEIVMEAEEYMLNIRPDATQLDMMLAGHLYLLGYIKGKKDIAQREFDDSSNLTESTHYGYN